MRRSRNVSFNVEKFERVHGALYPVSGVDWQWAWMRGFFLPLLLLVESGHSLHKGLGIALDLIHGLDGALDLVAALTGVGTPLVHATSVGRGRQHGKGHEEKLHCEKDWLDKN